MLVWALSLATADHDMKYRSANHALFDRYIVTLLLVTFWLGKMYALAPLILVAAFFILRNTLYYGRTGILSGHVYILLAFLFGIFPAISYPIDVNVVIKVLLTPLLITYVVLSSACTYGSYIFHLKTLMFVLLLISIILFFQVAPGSFDFSLSTLLSKSRTEGYYLFDLDDPSSPTFLAAILANLVILSFYLTHYLKQNFLIFGSVFALSTIMLIVSAGRTSWAVVTVFFLYVAYKKNYKNFISYGLGAIIVVATMYMFLIPVIATNQMDNDFADRISLIFSLESDSSALTRVYYWEQAVSELESSWLGKGYYYFIDTYGGSTHNQVLGDLVATGIFSTLFMYVAITSFYRGHFKQAKRANESDAIDILFVTNIMIFLMFGLLEHYSFSGVSVLWPLFWYLLAVCYKAKKVIGNDRNRCS